MEKKLIWSYVKTNGYDMVAVIDGQKMFFCTETTGNDFPNEENVHELLKFMHGCIEFDYHKEWQATTLAEYEALQQEAIEKDETIFEMVSSDENISSLEKAIEVMENIISGTYDDPDGTWVIKEIIQDCGRLFANIESADGEAHEAVVSLEEAVYFLTLKEANLNFDLSEEMAKQNQNFVEAYNGYVCWVKSLQDVLSLSPIYISELENMA